MGRVLIIDDDPDIIETMVSLLDGPDFSVKALTNAKEGLILLETESFDTIISDISMPQMSGLEFLAELRKKGIDTPLIFVSGSDLSEHIKQALQLGAADFISKPFDVDQMIQKVSKFVEIGKRVEKLRVLGPDADPNEIERNKKIINLLKVSNALKDVA